MASNSEEEFSFPATNLPCFIESPPLWRLGNSKTCKKNEQAEEEEEEDEDKFSISDDDYGHQEDKMDMLWEGLNEDSSSSCTGETCTEKSSNLSSSPGKEVHICCINNVFKLPAAKSSRGDMKSSIPVFIRVLKKGFAKHHSLPSVKKCAAW
ncbi:hypothetical protein ACP275_14G331200 [Erythranthe tilingii]